jgi:TetR/AcrR family transcriptional repressor of lmrAB and yxaGH operons
MAAHPRHRESIVRTAAVLFRRQGYAATGTNQIVAESGAPKGSLYHYFPAGKEQIGQAAVAHAGALVARTLADLLRREPTPGAALRGYGRLLAGWLEESQFRDGCPIATTLLELAPASSEVADAGRAAFDAWTGLLAGALRDAGAPEETARRLAGLALGTIEGALLVARVRQDAAPLTEAIDDVAALFDGATAAPRTG